MYNFYFSNKISYSWFILFGLILHIIAAYYSVGYYSADEHYQIIGPLEKLLGIENTLTWEFKREIRPWLQPYFYFYISKIINFLNINNPFIIAFYLRLVSSIIGFVSILYLYNHLKYKLNLDNNFSKLIIFSFWFYAFLHARTSSENLSISMLIFGMIYFDKFLDDKYEDKKIIYSILSGIFLGLSMIFRYQIVISVFFIFLWFLFNKFSLIKIKYVILSSVTIIFVLLFSLIFDFFGYGHFTNTFYKYYLANFVAKFFASFGIEPWWYYVKLFFEKFFPPINIIIFVSIIFFWIKKPKNIITFITLPVIITLSFLSHKELRFIFPILIFTPFFVSYLFSNTKLFFAKIFLMNLIVLFNILFIIILFIPATEQVKVYEYLYYNQNENNPVYFYDNNPYLIDDLEPRLYTSFLPKISKYKTKYKFKNSILVVRKFESYKKLLEENSCKLVYSVYPQYINLVKNWRDKSFNWYIFFCNE